MNCNLKYQHYHSCLAGNLLYLLETDLKTFLFITQNIAQSGYLRNVLFIITFSKTYIRMTVF